MLVNASHIAMPVNTLGTVTAAKASGHVTPANANPHVIPAKAGIQFVNTSWTPAFAGVTAMNAPGAITAGTDFNRNIAP